MAPRKPKTLQDLRHQVVRHSRSIASVTNKSAFHAISKKNERFVNGRAIERPEPETVTKFLPTKVHKLVPARTKTRAAPKPKPVAKPAETAEPEVECWRAAGGDLQPENEGEDPSTPTRVLGLARLPHWALQAFETSVKAAIEDYGEAQELVTREVIDGAEECIDVYAVFRSELAAEVVKEGVEEGLVGGKRLRVRYASAEMA